MTQRIIARNDEQTLLASSDKYDSPIIMQDDNWYFLPEQINMDYLQLTDRTWKCPDRGVGYWYDLVAPGLEARNVAWAYPEAKGQHESIAPRIGFWGRDTAISTAEDTVDIGSEELSR
jgi:uncharacterized protein (DUF427 family)